MDGIEYLRKDFPKTLLSGVNYFDDPVVNKFEEEDNLKTFNIDKAEYLEIRVKWLFCFVINNSKRNSFTKSDLMVNGLISREN